MNDSEYISKDAFVAQRRKQYCENCERRKGTKNGKRIFVYKVGEAPCRACNIGDMIAAVWDFPPADVAPVVHGYWKKCKPDALIWWECSMCSVPHYLDEPRGVFCCPNCGAKMDESEENINEN